MCHYERGIVLLSFPDISFVILLYVFQRFEIKPGFPFFTHTVYSHDSGAKICNVFSMLVNDILCTKQSIADYQYFAYIINDS